MGFTNRSKTNVARSESWTPAAALQNRLKKLEEEICCLTPALYGGKGFVQKTLTTAEIGSALGITGLFTQPVELVPALGPGKIAFPTKIIVTFTCSLASFNAGPDNLEIRYSNAGVNLPSYLFRNSLSTPNTRTLSNLALLAPPFIGGANQIIDDSSIIAYSDANPILLVGGDLELEILLWYDIINFETP